MPGSRKRRMQSTLQAAAVVNIAEKAAKLGYFVFDPKARRTRFASGGLKHITSRVYGGNSDVSIDQLFARVHEEDRARVMASVLSTIETGAPLDIEYRVVCDDGETLYLWMTNAEIEDPDEGVVRVGIVQDLTERHERETNLQENVALKRAIIDAALDAVVIIDAEGVICDFNPTAEDSFGFTKDEVVGKTLSETIVPERYRAAHQAGLERYLREGTPRVIGNRIEIEAVRKNGEEFPIELAIKQINVGDRLLFTANIRDISDRRAAEHQRELYEAKLEQAKEDAEAANKAKSEFLAAMSHEIRTPLNGVLGVLTLLGDTELSDEQRQLLSTAYGSGQNLFTLISDVLDLSKIEAGKMDQEFVDFNPRSVAQEAAGLVEAITRRKGLAISIEARTDLPTVRSDQAQIRQVLANLVSNAAKFTDSGSIEIRIRLKDNLLRYEVEDTGIGISCENRSRLFRKFSQIDPSNRRRYGGTGLGLSICKELVQLLDGDIGVDSEEGKGSVFWFEVPVREAEKPVVDPAAGFSSLSTIEINKRILLAEDSYTNALVASSFLRSAGARVDIASNGLEVLSATSSRKYDLVIMDVSMPEMDGIEASEMLRAQQDWTREVPILALTANASREDRAKCITAGMNAFLTKPVERAKLLSAVHDLLTPHATGHAAAGARPAMDEQAGGVFDRSSIETAYGDMPGLFTQVIKAFQGELHQRVRHAEAAVQSSDFKTLARMGHALKSAAANVHASEISDSGKDLETSACAGDLAAAQDALSRLKRLADRADTEIPALPFMQEAS